jgi:hypothetical protein
MEQSSGAREGYGLRSGLHSAPSKRSADNAFKVRMQGAGTGAGTGVQRYLTGQRPGDVLKFNERQIVDGVFLIKKQSKTGTPLRIRVEGEFGKLLERIANRRACQKFCVRGIT